MKTDLISRSELFNKLATVPIKAESVETTTEIFKIINSMQTESVDIAESVVEQICDKYCKFPGIVESDNELDRICDNCPLDNIASARIESESDLISRADAIEAVMAEGRKVYTSEYANAERVIYEADAVEAIKQAIYNHDSAIMRITSLPSAETVQGEWRRVETRTYKGECTNCGFRHIFMDGHDSQYRFCPNCGARMYKGGDDE